MEDKPITLDENKIKIQAINYARERYGWTAAEIEIACMEGFKTGALSDAAKEYWFNQWQSQQTTVSKKEIVQLEESELKRKYIKENTVGWDAETLEKYLCEVENDFISWFKGYAAGRSETPLPKPVEDKCDHEEIIDIGNGLYHCPDCSKTYTYEEWNLHINYPTSKHPVEDKHNDAKYLYYQIDLKNIPIEWDTTICEDLDEVKGILQFLDIYFDDDTIEAEVTIKGIGMSSEAYGEWKKEYIKEDNPEPTKPVSEEVGKEIKK